jgi:two-component system response regulator
MGYQADLSKISSFEAISRVASLLAICTARRVFVLDVTKSIRLDIVRKVLFCSLLLTGLCDQNLASTLQNNENSGEPFKRLSLEQLDKIEVATISEGPAETTRTPAATLAITQENIRRSGATIITEVLHLVAVSMPPESNPVNGPSVCTDSLPWGLARVRVQRMSNILNEALVARDGVEALNYLFGEVAYADRNASVMSQVVSANSYVLKLVDFNQFMHAVHQLGMYWLILNEPPLSRRP